MNKPKRHHTVPDGNLKGFTRDGKTLWVYKRGADHPITQPTKNTAVRKHFYRFTDVDGNLSNAVEEAFANVVESGIPQIIAKLDQKQKLTDEEFDKLGAFITFQYLRTPRFREDFNKMQADQSKWFIDMFFSNKESVAMLMEDYKRDKGDHFSNLTPEELQKMVLEGFNIDVEIPKEHSMQFMMENAEKLQFYLFHQDWYFLHAPKNGAFITSDDPFTLIAPPNLSLLEGAGIAMPDTQKVIPLSSKTCVVIYNLGPRYRGFIDVNRKQVRMYNRIIAYNCHQEIYGQDEALVRNVAKLSKLKTVPYVPQMGMVKA